jgi:hypothetical protein
MSEPVKAEVGRELTLTLDALPASTSDYYVLASAQKDGKHEVTLLPLATGRLDFAGTKVEVGLPELPADVEPRDIKPPIRAWPAVWPWLLLALLGAAAWRAWREWERRKGLAPEKPAEPVLPLEFRIERRLKELEASRLWEEGRHAAYYLRLTEILRAYLEERWGVPATAMTSGEVARLVKARATLKEAGVVRPLLERADLVKFARQTPQPGDGPRDLEEVRRFVFATSPGELAAAAPEREAA